MKIREKEVSIKHLVVVLIAILAIAYFLFQARFMVLGPVVEITSPQNGALVATPVVSVEGRSQNIAWITLNDRQIYTDESGNWSESLVVSPGESVMTVKTKDRFGREEEKSIKIYAN